MISDSIQMRPFEFIFGLNQPLSSPEGCVATIGSFDGVHLGHQAILQRLSRVGRKLDLPVAVMIFEPQPNEYFAREHAPVRLMGLRDKVAALSRAGADIVLCLKFDTALRSLTADQFVEQILVERLRVKHLEIGDDFRFGCDRAGDFNMLRREGDSKGFSVCDTQTLTIGDQRVSSTRIRCALQEDRLGEANALLGAPLQLSGRIIYGRQLGRTIGVPTANVALGRYRSSVQGVYAVRANISGGVGVKNGVANVGTKPTVDGSGEPLLEVHLFDFDASIYGHCMQVQFLKKIREEKKFDSFQELTTQINADIQASKQFFASVSGE